MPVAALLDNGERLHLQHGPIDLIIGADDDRKTAFDAAWQSFRHILDGLMEEITRHRAALMPDTAPPQNPTARRMYDAARPFCGEHFLTPMIAVAGSVADTVLAAMLDAAPMPGRAYVNNGGDISVYLDGDCRYAVAMAASDGTGLGRIAFDATSRIGGIATSGAPGRSFSFGIADSVTVLARDAATADVAATLIANAVDLPGHCGIIRTPARELLPDSDLGDRRVVTSRPHLEDFEVARALAPGRELAAEMLARGQIIGAGLFLQGHSVLLGNGFDNQERIARKDGVT